MKTRRIWRLLDLEQILSTYWRNFESREIQEVRGHLDRASPSGKSCLGVMLRRANEGGQLLLGNCVKHLQRRGFKGMLPLQRGFNCCCCWNQHLEGEHKQKQKRGNREEVKISKCIKECLPRMKMKREKEANK